MKDIDHAGQPRFRVWIAEYDHWQPHDHRDVPPVAVAMEPAEEGVMSPTQAAVYVEAFNRVALGRRRKVWAIALPVTVRYEGEPRPGQRIDSRVLRPDAGRAPELIGKPPG